MLGCDVFLAALRRAGSEIGNRIISLYRYAVAIDVYASGEALHNHKERAENGSGDDSPEFANDH